MYRMNEEIQCYLRQKHVSQERLASALGYSRNTVVGHFSTIAFPETIKIEIFMCIDSLSNHTTPNTDFYRDYIRKQSFERNCDAYARRIIREVDAYEQENRMRQGDIFHEIEALCHSNFMLYT